MVFWSSVPPIPCTWNEIPYRSVPYFKCSTCFNKMRCRDMFQLQSYVSLTPLPLPTCKRPSCSGSWPSCTCCILQANRTSWRWNIPHTLLCHSQSVTNRIKINFLHLPICTLCFPWWLGEETNRPPLVHERQRSWPQHWRPKPPRSLEASKRWARGRCQFFLQQTELLHPVRAESMRKQFTSFQIHFYRPPCLQIPHQIPSPFWWEHLQRRRPNFWGWLAETARKQKCSCGRRAIGFLWIRKTFSGQLTHRGKLWKTAPGLSEFTEVAMEPLHLDSASHLHAESCYNNCIFYLCTHVTCMYIYIFFIFL